ncbi:MAG: hypothetical protein QF575_00100 [Acidimicrobiales bacterium]|nr:hypothetical protein [Acidimicrobiales bacterium]
MSTLSFDLALILGSVLAPGLVLGALLHVGPWSTPSALQPATVPTGGGAGTGADRWKRPLPRVTLLLLAVRGRPLPPSGETELAVERGWGVFARLGVGLQPPRKVATGRRARIRWWHRCTSLALLLAIVVLVGLALASLTAVLIVAGGFLLEQAIG